jgi:WbqC-like protein family
MPSGTGKAPSLQQSLNSRGLRPRTNCDTACRPFLPASCSPSMKRIAIIQSAYVPWRGFFDLIGRCDEYVIFDTVQYAKRHWHNRNKVKTAGGPVWITIPVATKSRFEQPIQEVRVSEPWAEKHWRTIAFNYRRAPHYKTLAPRLETLLEAASEEIYLTRINERFLCEIATMLGLKTKITRDATYAPLGSKTARLLDICLKAGATHYLSGPSAREYLDENAFREAGIEVEWMHYPAYPAYPQLWAPFEPAVSILDLLLNAGRDCTPLWKRGESA